MGLNNLHAIILFHLFLFTTNNNDWFACSYMVLSNPIDYYSFSDRFRVSLCYVLANVLDCNIIASKFQLQLCYYVYFQTNALGKGMNPLIPQSIG